MKSRYFLSGFRWTFDLIVLCSLLISALGAGSVPTARAEGVRTPNTAIHMQSTSTNPEVRFGAYLADQELQQLVVQALAIRPSGILNGNKFGITSEREEANWILLSIISLDAFSTPEDLAPQGNLSGLILIENEAGGNKQAALAGTPEFSSLVNNVPISFLTDEAKVLIDPLAGGVSTAAAVPYKFPWAPGNWEYRQGWHQGTALDVGTGGTDKRVLASGDGLIVNICKGQLSANVSVRHTDGNTISYYHIDVTHLGPDIAEGKEVLRGQVLGTLRSGTWTLDDDTPSGGTPCGYTVGQLDTSAHIHWVIPSSITVDGWSITSSDSTWRRGSETRGITSPYSLLPSTNYVIAKQYEYKSTWLTAPGGWPYLFVLDPEIRRFTVDGSSPYTVYNECNSVWVNLSPGDHTLVEYYEVRDAHAPTIDLQAWPVLVTPVCAGGPTDPPSNPGDGTPPSGSWTSPSGGQTISSRSVILSVNANDNAGGSGVKEVRFSAAWGGQWRAVGTDNSSPYSLSWDMCSAGVPNGDVELGMEVWDNANNVWVYSQHYTNIHITKNYTCTQSTTDTTPPTASWTSPGNGQTVSAGSVTLSANASDNSGGSGVREVRWSALWSGQWHGIGSDNSAPYSMNWDWCAAGVPNGDVELGMEAWDNANNVWIYSQHSTNYHITKNYTCSGGSTGGWETWGWQNHYLAGYDNMHATVTWANGYPYIWWDFGSGGPFSGWGGDDFSLRMQKDVYFPGGYYSFHAEHDDGVRVYVDGTLKIDAWWDGNGGHDAGMNLSQGNHQIKVEYYETVGDARLHVFWYGPGYPQPDNNPPSGRITYPSDGAAIGASPLTVNADASDDVSGVNRVEFYAWYCSSGCDWHLIATDYSAPYSISWDWSSVPDQHLYLTTHMYDNTGKSVYDPGGYVGVDFDRTSPTASITSPVGESTLNSNPVTITAAAIDSLSGVNHVDFFAGYDETGSASTQGTHTPPPPAAVNEAGMLTASDLSGQDYWHSLSTDTNGNDGWSSSWNTAGVPAQTNAAVFLYAYDRAGNSVGAAQWNLTVGMAPELNISAASANPASAYTNDDVFFYVTVSNSAAFAASGFWIDFYVDQTPTGCGDWGSYYGWQSGVAANDVAYWYIRVPANTLSPGTHTFRAYVDSGCDVGESNESNNISSATTFTVSAPPVGAPGHDDFAAPRTVSPIPYTDNADIRGATTSWDDPEVLDCGGYGLTPGMASVWYTYTPSSNTSLYLDTFGSNYDTYIAAWTGTRGNLALVGCNDDYDYGNDIFTSGLRVDLTGGVTYYFEVADFGDSFSALGSAAALDTTHSRAEGFKAGTSPAITKLRPDVQEQAGGTLQFHVDTYKSTTSVLIHGSQVGNYTVMGRASMRQSYAGANNGPVQVLSTNSTPIVASERVAYYNGSAWASYAELMGLPSGLVTDTYVFPWYNSANLSSQVSVGNVGTGSTTVTVTIGGSVVDSYTLDPNASKRVKYFNLNTGPVVVHSSGGVPIIASERISYTPDGIHYTSYSELMGLPASELTDTYYFPWYNSVNLSEQVSVANVGSGSTTVTVTIGGVARDVYTLGPNQSRRAKYAGLNTGPVVVHSTGSVPIIASERISFSPNGGATYTGYSEMMGLPAARLTNTYALPWYNSVDHSMQVSVANVGASPSTVNVTIGGLLVDSYSLAAGASKRVKYAGITNGPVVVTGTPGVAIIASERTSYTPDGGVTYPSFSEMLGLPSGLLTDTYLFPWYNNVNLNTEVRFGVP